ncbi:MAG: 3-hydroxy-3-methylglutaryl-CoA reductase, partial [Methanobacteriaceae archaeon]|nr:3-hydroxy-3-methylglutaryl-CoA reductase [Methanobacteriaceae archaeon]
MHKKDEIVHKLLKGEIKLHQVENYTESVEEATQIRLMFAQKISGAEIEHLSQYSIDMGEALKRNIENPIGAIQIPVGIAGPLTVKGEHAQGDFYVPLATSEGALVASVNRGCSVIKASGGVKVGIVADKMTRAPVIKASSLQEALKIREWIEDNFEALKKAAES